MINTVCCHPTNKRQFGATYGALCHEEMPLVVDRGASVCGITRLFLPLLPRADLMLHVHLYRMCPHTQKYTNGLSCAYVTFLVQSYPRCVFVCTTVPFKYATLVRTLTCAGLLLICCRVTVSLSDGCDSDSSSPSPPSHNKAPASLRSAHNQVSWSCDAWRSGNQRLKFPQGIFNVVVSLFVGSDCLCFKSDTGN